MEEMREDYNDLRRSRSSPVAEIITRKHAFETPKVQRPQDKAYQDILSASKTQPQPPENTSQQSFKNYNNGTNNEQNEMMKLYDVRMTNLMSSM